MKFTNILAFIFFFALAVFAQKPDDVLATATGHTFRFRDLSANTQATVAEMPAQTKKARTEILGQLLNERAIRIEAKSLNISPGRLIANEKAKIPNPTEETIKAVYEANRTVVGDRTLEQVRKQIVSMLRSDPEQKALSALFTRLNAKYKPANGKDINAPVLAAADVVATVNGQPVTAREFEEYARFQFEDIRFDLAGLIFDDLNETVYQSLINDEAKVLKIDASTLLANEVTNKMRDFTDQERDALEGALRKRLFTKYQVKILYTGPAPIVQNISVDDDPSQGPLTAPVTIVMFSDFQCSACSATHPVLKKVMAEYPGKIRFVVRDFPLESIHENAWASALAANAAHAQGKFLEFTELLYKNQDALDSQSLKKYAAQIGLNVAQFEIDSNSAKTITEVRKDMSDGESYGVSSTPTVFVNGISLRVISADAIRVAIERALKR